MSLQQRRWYRKCFFFKVYQNKCPKYLLNIILISIANTELEIHTVPPLHTILPFLKARIFHQTLSNEANLI